MGFCVASCSALAIADLSVLPIRRADFRGTTARTACAYPDPYDEICKGREKQALGDAVGLDQFGVNLTRLKPGAASAQKHWHKNEDELVYILAGEVVLVEDTGETILRAGEAAGFKAGVENGHMLINRSSRDCLLLEVGTRADNEISSYTDPNVDMRAVKENGGTWQIQRKDGSAF